MGMGFQSLPVGIPIPDEVHDLFPDNVKEAWKVFDGWWQGQGASGGPIKRSAMPDEVKAAEKVILEAPIPGYGGATGKDSCYMVFVQANLID